MQEWDSWKSFYSHTLYINPGNDNGSVFQVCIQYVHVLKCVCVCLRVCVYMYDHEIEMNKICEKPENFASAESERTLNTVKKHNQKESQANQRKKKYKKALETL